MTFPDLQVYLHSLAVEVHCINQHLFIFVSFLPSRTRVVLHVVDGNITI
jgi:hypothetical protein